MNLSDRVDKTQKRFMSYLFYDKRFIASSMGRIVKDHLSDYGYLYVLLVSYYNKYRDVITDDSANLFFQKKNLDNNTIVKYKSLIGELRSMLLFDGSFIGNEAEFNMLMDELDEIKKRKDYIKVAELIVDANPLSCTTEKLEDMEQKIKQEIVSITARKGEVRKEGTIADSASERFSNYLNVKNNPETIRAVPTGFSKIDDANGGFRAGELIYVIGRKGDGKSVALLNFAHNAWVSGHNVIIFTLEISKEDYERRFDSRAAGVPSNGLKMGKLQTKEEKKKAKEEAGDKSFREDDLSEEETYEKYIESLKSGKVESFNTKTKRFEMMDVGTMYVVDCPSGCTPAFVESKLDTIEQTLGIKFDVVVTDYAGIMKPNVSVAEKRHEQGQIALDQKRIARERECVVISAAQMTREGGKSKEADTSHVAESDQVSDHIDWGIAVRSISKETGKMESFKTRDAEPFSFSFSKQYDKMKMVEIEDNDSAWTDMIAD
jgi:replicative DNA helicase